VFLIFR
jgi:hypothetical protein